jgi:hypothetical protein
MKKSLLLLSLFLIAAKVQSHVSGLNQSYNPGTVSLGGGLDVKVKSRFAVRVIQGDLIKTYFPYAIDNRFSTGVVVRL